MKVRNIFKRIAKIILLAIAAVVALVMIILVYFNIPVSISNQANHVSHPEGCEMLVIYIYCNAVKGERVWLTRWFSSRMRS